MMIQAYGDPVPQGSKKYLGNTKVLHRPIMVDQNAKGLATWRSDIVGAVRRYMEDNPDFCRFESAVVARMVFSFQRPRSSPQKKRPFMTVEPDLDKLARGVGDALQVAGAIANDSLIVDFTRLAKVYCGEDPEALEIPGCLIILGALVPLDQVEGPLPGRKGKT
jgi:Holliday junction resolvase RusA-like endonuclease